MFRTRHCSLTYMHATLIYKVALHTKIDISRALSIMSSCIQHFNFRALFLALTFSTNCCYFVVLLYSITTFSYLFNCKYACKAKTTVGSNELTMTLGAVIYHVSEV